jgi:hypothetical protein
MTETTAAPAQVEARTLETVVCTRCGGSGRMPFAVYGGKCFKCDGAGKVYTAKGRAAANYLNALRSRKASEITVGMLVLDRGVSAGSFTQPAQWCKVLTIRPGDAKVDGGSVVVVDGVETVVPAPLVIETDRMAFHVSPDSVMRVGLTAEEKRATFAAALDYQDTLTKAGKPRKVRAAKPRG